MVIVDGLVAEFAKKSRNLILLIAEKESYGD